MKNCRYCSLWLSGLAFIGVLSWLFYAVLNPARPSLEKYSKILSSRIEARSAELNNLLESLRLAVGQQADNSTENNLWDHDALCSLFNETYTITIYKDKKKVFWNNSNTPAIKIDSIFDQSVVLNRPEGIFIYSGLTDSIYSYIITEPVYKRYPIKNQYLKDGFVGMYSDFRNNKLIINDIVTVSAFKVQLFDGSFIYLASENQSDKAHHNGSFTIFDIAIALLVLFLSLLERAISGTPLQPKFKRFSLFFPIPLILFYLGAIAFVSRYRSLDYFSLLNPVLRDIYSPTGFPLSASLLYMLISFYFHRIIHHAVRFTFSPALKSGFIFLALIFTSIAGELLFSTLMQRWPSDELFLSWNISNPYLITHSISMLMVASATILLIGKLLKDFVQMLNNRILAAFFILLPWVIQVLIYLAYNQFFYLFFALPVILFFSILPAFIHGNKTSEKPTLILSWLLVSISLAVSYGVSNQRLADDEQLLTAKKLSADNDPLLEFLFSDLKQTMESDSLLKAHLFNQNAEDQYINNYIREKYITGYLSKYETEVTTCYADQDLVLQPENRKVNCIDYFGTLAAIRGSTLSPGGLFLIDNNLLGVHYAGYLIFEDIQNHQSDRLHVFIEFFYKYIPEGTGYPDLLIDAGKGIGPDLNKYSFASYRDGALYYKFGSYFFPLRLEQMTGKTEGYFNRDGYRHAVLMFADKVLLISRKEKNWAEMLAPFSFFLLLNGFILLLLNLFRKGFQDLSKVFSTFRTRLQLIISVSLLASFSMIGVITTIYMADIYRKKNDDFLAEKTQSLLVELEHKLKDIPFGAAMRDYLNQILLKFSLVFFTDINLYDGEGRLLATSRPEIFDLGLTGEMMHPEAFRAMRIQNRLYLRQYEEIGQARFISAYAPFKNSNGEAIAYINLPYFVKESETQREVRSMLLSYLNLFLLLSALSLLFALFVSRRLTKPLQMIQQKMSRVQLGHTNEKIYYQRYDEIGELVKQYNTLLDQLALSAQLLARSERETAWREMAKQVAHEIKNPLTPMRLSVQYLLRAWNDKDPEIDHKLKNISQTLISQIDTLSSIASAFSDFAVMPQPKPIRLNLSELLSKAVNLFDHQDNIKFVLSIETTSIAFIHADPENLNSIFTNLIKNSIQAIGNKPDAQIRIHLTETIDHYLVRVADTGKGMTEEEASKVFTPNFTTKSSGMGMGLSIVYSLVHQAGGTISFETRPGEGTAFTIALPKAENKT